VRTEKVLKTSISDTFIVEINILTSIHDWILDTRSCTHICSNMQALKNRRKLRNKEI
jgi:hypothetical protein